LKIIKKRDEENMEEIKNTKVNEMTPEMQFEPVAKYDRQGNLHILLQEGRYIEYDDGAELKIMALEIIYTEEGVRSDCHYFDIMKFDGDIEGGEA
jgi:hypothetical protein